MGAGRFETTRWSLIIAAGGAVPEAREALNHLCAIYWEPLYAFVRRDRPRTPDDAADLTQAFFADLLSRDDLAGLAPERGRFRSWLLQAMRNFLSKETERAHAAKRGGGAVPLPLDVALAERRYGREPTDGLDAEKLYTRRWANVAIERALAKFWADSAAQGEQKRRELEAVKEVLLGEPPEGGYEAIAARLGTTAGALRMAALKWRKVVRAEVAETLALGADVDAELAELIGAMS
jgi:RNA polymerase sigma-70 factor (ECF subfamily)